MTIEYTRWIHTLLEWYSINLVSASSSLRTLAGDVVGISSFCAASCTLVSWVGFLARYGISCAMPLSSANDLTSPKERILSSRGDPSPELSRESLEGGGASLTTWRFFRRTSPARSRLPGRRSLELES